MSYRDISPERRRKVEDWLDLPPNKRVNVLDFRRKLHLSTANFRLIKAQWKIQNELTNAELADVRRKRVAREYARGRGNGKDYHKDEGEITPDPSIRANVISQIEPLHSDALEPGSYSADYADDDINIALDTLRRVAREGTDGAAVNASRTILQKYGLLVEKQERTHKLVLNADEHLRIEREAERRVSEFLGTADGVKSLPPKQSLLPAKIRADTRPG